MTHTIAVEGADINFTCHDGETILVAAERAGYTMPYSCRKGVCASCEGFLSKGDVKQRSKEMTGPAGKVLFCTATAKSDLTIRPRRIQRHDPLARKKIQARVFRMSRPVDDVAILQLRFPASIRAKFKAGQYLRIRMPDGDERSFSMANAPQESDGVQLHIRHVPGGAFSERVLASLELDDKLEVEVPFGDFHLREDDQARYVFVATGTGFAPLKSMLDDMIRRRLNREVRFYWADAPPPIFISRRPAKNGRSAIRGSRSFRCCLKLTRTGRDVVDWFTSRYSRILSICRTGTSMPAGIR